MSSVGFNPNFTGSELERLRDVQASTMFEEYLRALSTLLMG
jgi:hypothetical protein